MKVVEKYSDASFVDNKEFVTRRFQKSMYPISSTVIEHVRSKLCSGKTAVLFSGSWRFDFDAIYLEADFFKNNTISLNESTYFVDPNNTTLFNKAMHDINALNILILHSGVFCNYQSIQTILDKMKSYQQFYPKQIILSIPQERVNFNRLKYSANDIAQQYQAEILDDSFVIQRYFKT